MGLLDGASTWGIYKLSGETISERWARELQEIQNENTAQDEKQKELRIKKRLDRLTEEEWIKKQTAVRHLLTENW